jgi:hypothetical protein
MLTQELLNFLGALLPQRISATFDPFGVYVRLFGIETAGWCQRETGVSVLLTRCSQISSCKPRLNLTGEEVLLEALR